MAGKRGESTGKRTASAAGRILRSPRASKAAKSAAASALTQVRSAERPRWRAYGPNARRYPQSPAHGLTCAHHSAGVRIRSGI
jgi:hypothetical protein